MRGPSGDQRSDNPLGTEVRLGDRAWGPGTGPPRSHRTRGPVPAKQQVTRPNLPSPETLRKITEAFSQYRPEAERTVEYAALEVIREFLDSFQDPPQRRMVYEVLAAGMRHAKRPDHAVKAEALVNGYPGPSAPENGS